MTPDSELSCLQTVACIQVTVWWAAYQRYEFLTLVIHQVGYLISGSIYLVVVQESLMLIAQMDWQLKPWKDGIRQRERHIHRFIIAIANFSMQSCIHDMSIA